MKNTFLQELPLLKKLSVMGVIDKKEYKAYVKNSKYINRKLKLIMLKNNFLPTYRKYYSVLENQKKIVLYDVLNYQDSENKERVYTDKTPAKYTKAYKFNENLLKKALSNKKALTEAGKDMGMEM